MCHVIVHVHARLWQWRVICMPIHLKGSAVCASLRLEQQSCCSNSNMQIVWLLQTCLGIVLRNTAKHPTQCDTVDPLAFTVVSGMVWMQPWTQQCGNSPGWLVADIQRGRMGLQTLSCCDSFKFLTCILNLKWYFWHHGHLGTEEIWLLSYNGMQH